jgi:lambda family phage portal protein
VEVKQNILDRVVSYFSPEKAVRRTRARLFEAVSGSYFGASRTRRATSEWNPVDADPDSTIQYDLAELRRRSRDLCRNAPLAVGAINTNCSNIVGTGLKLQAQINRNILNIADEAADAWENKVEAEWSLLWDTKDVDSQKTLTGNAIVDLVLRQTLENGEIFVTLPRIDRGGPYSLKLQLIEADRVSTPDGKTDSDTLFLGIEKDKNGAPSVYHVCNQFPFAYRPTTKKKEWTPIAAYSNKTGLPNIIHVFKPLRPGQSRGVPYIAPVIEALKMIDRYTEAELMAAVISSMLTVFIKTETGESGFDLSELGQETGAQSSDKDIKLASGAIIDLAKGESIETVDPQRPNQAFDPFVMAILRQIGVALELPFEVLIKHFTASYSAARAALLEAWKYFRTRRQWLAENFLQIVYEVWLYEAVASGRIDAPGFFNDPLIRKAYSGSEWIGPAPGQIDPLKETKAAENRMAIGLSTHAQETASLGGDWETNIKAITREVSQIKESGLLELSQKAPTLPGNNANNQTGVDNAPN